MKETQKELFNEFDGIQRQKAWDEEQAQLDKKLDRVLNWLGKIDPDYQYGETIESEKIIIANWNKISDKYPNFDVWSSDTFGNDIVWGYDDEYYQCNHCYKYIPIYPSYYGDTQEYVWLGDCEVLCPDCAFEFPSDLIEEYTNQTNKAFPNWGVDVLKEDGFICLDSEDTENCAIFENGFYPGQNDNPVDIIAKFGDTIYKYDYVFVINSAGQFDVQFSLWLKEL